jgi:hypothetical protein
MALLDAGIHYMSLAEFRTKFVDKFPHSKRRKVIFDCFSSYAGVLLSTGIVTEIWLNGSFVTSKEEPEDIDAVAFFDQIKADKLKGVDTQIMDKLPFDKDRIDEIHKEYYTKAVAKLQFSTANLQGKCFGSL